MKSFRTAMAAMLAVLASMAFAGQASATSYMWFNGSGLSQQGSYGPRHTITNVEVYNPYAMGVCQNAMNDDGSWAGTTICATSSFNHPYCGCALRYPWIGAASYETYVAASGTEYY